MRFLVSMLALVIGVGGVSATEPEPVPETEVIATPESETTNLEVYAGQTIKNIEIEGNNVTKDYVEGGMSVSRDVRSCNIEWIHIHWVNKLEQ